uniref:Coilin_N domain-containing protein n=1 Tax=Anopheles epiroticus TaxID=199890 RepID=A0A182PB12_9DIPT
MLRYLLNLSALYSDYRQKAYIGHRPSWNTVGCLIRTVRQIFSIESDLYVCSEEGVLYPESESVDLLEDELILKIFPKVPVEARKKTSSFSEDEPRKRNATSIPQESSTYEDIESVLLGLPKPKRRRVRKRKVKHIAEEEQPSSTKPSVPSVQVKQPVTVSTENGHVRFPEEEPHSGEERALDEPEAPYRNLNRTMKARVVRAVSPSTLVHKKTMNDPPPSKDNGDAGNTSESDKCNSNTSVKARIVRALGTQNAVEVKREQLEANKHVQAVLQQLYPQSHTMEEDDGPVIEVGSPFTTHLSTAEEGTRVTDSR